MNLPQTPLEQFRSQQATPLHSNNNSSVNVSGYFDIPFSQALENNLKKKQVQTPIFDIDYMSHIPSYTEALDDDDDGAGEDFAPGYSDSGSESVSVVSGGTTPIKIKLPTNNSTGHFKFSSKNNSLPNTKSNSSSKLDLESSLKLRFFHHSKKK